MWEEGGTWLLPVTTLGTDHDRIDRDPGPPRRRRADADWIHQLIVGEALTGLDAFAG